MKGFSPHEVLVSTGTGAGCAGGLCRTGYPLCHLPLAGGFVVSFPWDSSSHRDALVSVPLRLYLCPGDGGPFFLWARRGRRIWPWVLALAVCLGLFRLLCIDINATNNLLALVTGYHNNESTAFHLLYLRVCYSGMLFGVALAAIVAWFLRKINS